MILVDYIFPHAYRDEANIIIKNSLPLVKISIYLTKIKMNLFWDFFYEHLIKILTNFTQTFLPIISLFFCGHIGPNELAAVTIACTVRKFRFLMTKFMFSEAIVYLI